jgi:uncharacterized membrane protein
MNRNLFTIIKPFLKPLLIVFLVATLVLSNAQGALAARSGGRAGGGSFRAPSRSVPSRPYNPPSGGGYYPGGGYGFPFLFPLFGFGGGFGGLFTILIFIAIANFLIRSFRSVQSGDSSGYSLGYSNPDVSVAKLQVGLLAEARSLQADLNRIANTADTGTPEGLTLLLQETTLSLLRHPEYWAYAGSEVKQSRLEAAEDLFNRLSLAERSKFTSETLSNYNNQLRQAPSEKALPGSGGALAQTEGPGEYIVVTLIVATQSKLSLPPINSTQELRQALGQFGSISSDNLLAVEVLWTPQAEGDVLTSDDMIAEYPDLKLI